MKGIITFCGFVVTAVLAGLVYKLTTPVGGEPSGAVIAVAVGGVLATLFVQAGTWQLNEWERGVILQWGKYKHVVGPGIFWVTPVAQGLAAIVDIRVVTQMFTGEQIMTKDNVALGLTIVLRFQIIDPKRAVIDVEDYRMTVEQAAQSALQNAIGRATLDSILSDRESLDRQLQQTVDEITEPWGVKIVAVEIRDIVLPQSLQQVMARAAEARRDGEARLILAETEVQAANMMGQAAKLYEQDPIAFQLRGMQMLVEVAKDRSTFFIVPSNGFTGMETTALSASVAQAMREQGHTDQ